MKMLVLFILIFYSCTIDKNQYDKETIPKIEPKLEQKKDTIIKQVPKVKPPQPSMKQYYYMRMIYHRKNPVA
jgi:hypothetical protein